MLMSTNEIAQRCCMQQAFMVHKVCAHCTVLLLVMLALLMLLLLQVLASLREFEHMSTLKKLVLQMVAFTMEPWQVYMIPHINNTNNNIDSSTAM
jgi:hypothetical protein